MLPMPNNELLRVGLPVRADRLVALITTIDPSEDAIVRHYNGALIIEEPHATFANAAADEGGE